MTAEYQLVYVDEYGIETKRFGTLKEIAHICYKNFQVPTTVKTLEGLNLRIKDFGWQISKRFNS